MGKAYAVYFRRVLPAVGRVICGKEGPYNYLPASVGNFPPPPAMLEDIDLLTADVEQAQEAGVKAALASRLDIMNARAQVVDSWRQLKVTANGLMGVATVNYHMQSQTPPDGSHPLAFSSAARAT